MKSLLKSCRFGLRQARGRFGPFSDPPGSRTSRPRRRTNTRGLARNDPSCKVDNDDDDDDDDDVDDDDDDGDDDDDDDDDNDDDEDDDEDENDDE